jgi:hypothetical protein
VGAPPLQAELPPQVSRSTVVAHRGGATGAASSAWRLAIASRAIATRAPAGATDAILQRIREAASAESSPLSTLRHRRGRAGLSIALVGRRAPRSTADDDAPDAVRRLTFSALDRLIAVDDLETAGASRGEDQRAQRGGQ